MGEQSNRSYNESILSSLTVGDLVEFPRGAYSHWAVYIGNGKVAHLVGKSKIGTGVSATSGSVFTVDGERFYKAAARIEDFLSVALGSPARIHNTNDGKWSPFSPEDIVKRAKSQLGYVEYNVMTSNCEHFANWCRYNKWQSDQVDNSMQVAALAGTGCLALGTAWLYSRNEKKKRTTKRLQQKR